jgi:cytochrome c
MRLVFGCLLGAAVALSATTAFAAGDATKGKATFAAKCGMCHQVGPNAGTLVGPELNDVVGRKAASVSGFSYSAGMKKLGDQGYVWTPEHIETWIKDPKAMIPDSPMALAFPGLPDQQDRDDVVAYLQSLK